MARYWQKFLEHTAAQTAHGELRRAPGIVAAWANAPVRFLNSTFLAGTATDHTDLEHRWTGAVADAHGRHLPWRLLVWDPFVGGFDTATVARAHGMDRVARSTVMTGDLRTLASARDTALEWRRVTAETDQREAYAINCRAHGIPESLADEILAAGPLFRNAEREFGYLGYSEGAPVTTATVVVLEDCLYVAWVATEAAHQRKGYGAAATWRSLTEAARATGFTRTALDASAAGLPAYQSMGYQPTGEAWSIYTAIR